MSWIWFFLCYVIIEIIINLIFSYVRNQLNPKEKRSRSIIKGVIERVFLITGLMLSYPQVIIAFGALKIGTRFQKNSEISNDYFLIGNFISLFAAMLLSYIAIQFIF